MIQWRYDPTVEASLVMVECYQRRLATPSQRWRWRARAVNGRKIANSGEGYTDKNGLADALALIWPPSTTRHVVVKGLD